MLLRNPFLHYPKYVARIIFVGGGAVRQNGTSLPDVEISYNEKDIAAICWEAMEASNVCRGTAMYYDGVWRDYDEELANRLEHHSITSLPESESYMCPPVEVKKKSIRKKNKNE